MSACGGIDLGGTKVAAIVFDPDTRNARGTARRPTPQKGGPPAIAAAIADCLADACEMAGVAPGALDGVGVGSPGEIDADAGTVANARNLNHWDAPFPLAAALSEKLGVSVALGNDVSVATEAEYRLGAGRGYQSLLGVFWGTGVGGGLILDGRPWHGRGSAGEIGHMVVKINGARCPCGRRGCLEAYAGRRAMERRARREVKHGRKTVLFEIMEKRGRPVLTSGTWERAIKHGDELAKELIDRAVVHLGAGIASAVNLIDVEAVVIGGGLGTRFGEDGLKRIAAEMEPHIFSDLHPAVHLAGLGDLSGAIGAALLCCGPAVVGTAL